MTVPRPHPFDLIFSPFAGSEFPRFRELLGNTPSLDQFLIAEPVIEWLDTLRPDEGIGDAMDEFVLLTHAAYRCWAEGMATESFDRQQTESLIASAIATSSDGTPRLRTAYFRIVPHLIWGRVEEANHEPLDGWFAVADGEILQVVGCLGVHPERPGLSVMTASGRRQAIAPRPDGTPPFAPTMSGGDLAGLHAIDTPDELLQLAWQAAVIR